MVGNFGKYGAGTAITLLAESAMGLCHRTVLYNKKIVVCEFSPQRQLSVEASKGQQLTAAVKLYGIGSWTMPELGRAAREAMKAAFSVLGTL